MRKVTAIGARLKEERTRLGMSQTDLAALAGAVYQTQGNYESGRRTPDADYLAAVDKAGVDILYVITGRRIPSGGTLCASPSNQRKEVA